MADPITLGLGSALSAGSSIAGGISGMQAAKGEKLRNDINAYTGETRAIQTATVANQSLESELGSIRAAFAANGQRPTSANLALLGKVRKVRNREKRIGVANEKRGAMDSRIAGRNATALGRAELFKGFGDAAPSLFDLRQVMK